MVRGRAWDVTTFQVRSTCHAKLSYIFLVIVHEYGLLLFGIFEYPGDDLSVGCTSHPGVRSVSLIDPDLTLYVYKKKICKVYFIFFAFDDETSVSMILVYFKYVYIYMCVCFSKTIFCQNMQSMLYIL